MTKSGISIVIVTMKAIKMVKAKHHTHEMGLNSRPQPSFSDFAPTSVGCLLTFNLLQ